MRRRGITEAEAEAASADLYTHKLTGKKYPRLQLRMVKELMEGKGKAEARKGGLWSATGHWPTAQAVLQAAIKPVLSNSAASQPAHSPDTGGKRFWPACQQATGPHRTGASPPVGRISACCTTESARGLAQSKTSRASGGTCS
jgi:hypothetical protein